MTTDTEMKFHNLCKFIDESGGSSEGEIPPDLEEHCVSRINNLQVAAGIRKIFPIFFGFLYKPRSDDFMQYAYTGAIADLINFLTLAPTPSGLYGTSRSSEIVKGEYKTGSTFAKRSILEKSKKIYLAIDDLLRLLTADDRNHLKSNLDYLINSRINMEEFVADLKDKKISEKDAASSLKKNAVFAFMRLQSLKQTSTLVLLIDSLIADLRHAGISSKGASIFSKSKAYRLDVDKIHNKSDGGEFHDE